MSFFEPFLFQLSVIVLLCTTTGAACFAQSSSQKEKPNLESQSKAKVLLSQQNTTDLETISKAKDFHGPYQGRGGSNPTWTAYARLRAVDSSLLFPRLSEMMKTATPSGKLYLACVFWDHDRNEGVKAFKTLLKDDSPISYSSGCTDHVEETVSAVAKSFIDSGEYRSFEAKKY